MTAIATVVTTPRHLGGEGGFEHGHTYHCSDYDYGGGDYDAHDYNASDYDYVTNDDDGGGDSYYAYGIHCDDYYEHRLALRLRRRLDIHSRLVLRAHPSPRRRPRL